MRARNILSTLLVLLGAGLLLAGVVAAYARVEVIERAAFADRSPEALQSAVVRRALEREVTDAVVERTASLGRSDPRTIKPEVRAVVQTVIASAPSSASFGTRHAACTGRSWTRAAPPASTYEGAPLVDRELQDRAPALRALVGRRLNLELVTV